MWYNTVKTDNTVNTDFLEDKNIRKELGNMQFEFSGNTEIYLEIADRYKKYIDGGIIKVGDKLPSVRMAALELGVNPNTVARAYSVLESDGYIRSIPKKGVYATDPSLVQKTVHDFRDFFRQLKADGITRQTLIEQIEEVYSND